MVASSDPTLNRSSRKALGNSKVFLADLLFTFILITVIYRVFCPCSRILIPLF